MYWGVGGWGNNCSSYKVLSNVLTVKVMVHLTFYSECQAQSAAAPHGPAVCWCALRQSGRSDCYFGYLTPSKKGRIWPHQVKPCLSVAMQTNIQNLKNCKLITVYHCAVAQKCHAKYQTGKSPYSQNLFLLFLLLFFFYPYISYIFNAF